MSRQIFRQAALDRLSSPERLDKPYTIVSSPTWLVLALIVFSAFFAAGWAVISRAPVKVKGQGILLQEQGLKELVSNEGGRINALNISVGDVVSKGTVIAQFRRTDIEREAGLVAAQIKDVDVRLKTLQKFYDEENRREDDREKKRAAGINESIVQTKRRRALLEKKVKDLRKLVRRKIVLQSRLITAELEVAESSEKLVRLQNEIRTIESGTAERRRRQRLSLLDENIKLDQLKRQLERLEAQLAERRVVVSPHEGRVAELKVALGDVVSEGQSIATLTPESDISQETVAVVYIPAADGKRVRADMDVEIVPSIYKRAQYGFIRGKIVSVASVPATREGMLRVLRNVTLADQLSGGASAFEVRISLTRDQTTESGLAWSSSDGPATTISPGTLIEADLIVDLKPIADLVVPGLSEKLGLAQDAN